MSRHVRLLRDCGIIADLDRVTTEADAALPLPRFRPQMYSISSGLEQPHR